MIGIIALIGGYLLFKKSPRAGENILSSIGGLLSIIATIGIVYAFIGFGIKDGLFSIVAFFMGGGVGAAFGRPSNY